MQIIDPNGKWYRNFGQFPFTDPETVTRFEPEELIKATETEWLKGQTVIVEMPDPEGSLVVAPEAPVKAKK